MLTVEQIEVIRTALNRHMGGLIVNDRIVGNDLCDLALQALAPPLSAERAESGIVKMTAGEQIAYAEGYKDAVREYAVWHNGEQFVGVIQRPLKEVLAEVDAEFGVKAK